MIYAIHFLVSKTEIVTGLISTVHSNIQNNHDIATFMLQRIFSNFSDLVASLVLSLVTPDVLRLVESSPKSYGGNKMCQSLGTIDVMFVQYVMLTAFVWKM